MDHPMQSLPAADAAATAPGWNLRTRLAYRFAATYFVLSFLPGVLFRPIDALVAGWLGVPPALLNLGPSGSGDKTADWVHALTVLTLSVVAAALWSVLDRKRREYTTAMAWTRLVLRYLLASVMLGYGLAKVFPTQFQPPTYADLVQPLGDFTPMSLLWSFMGASMGYTIFTGAMEALSALLLLFRRTALVGALIAVPVMTNVFALNMFYDVPVKLFSFHLLATALVIAAPDLGRLFRFAVLQKPADPPLPAGPVFVTRQWRMVGWGGKAIVLVLLCMQARAAHTRYAAMVASQPVTGTYRVAGVTYRRPAIVTRSPLAGTYRVEGFPGWQQVVVENAGSMRVTQDNGMISTYRLILNDSQSRLQLGDPNNPSGSLNFRIAGDGGVTLEGDLLGAPARMHLVRSEDFVLLRRGFHWVSERPSVRRSR